MRRCSSVRVEGSAVIEEGSAQFVQAGVKGLGWLGGRLGQNGAGRGFDPLQLTQQALQKRWIRRPRVLGQNLCDVNRQVDGRWRRGLEVLHTKLVYKYKCSPSLDIRQFW